MSDLSKRTLLSHVQEVRTLLNDTGCMESNPFFFEKDRKALAELFTLFASDVENAAQKLEIVTGIEDSLKTVSADNVDQAANELVMDSSSEDRDVYLSKVFDAARAKPFFALCNMERFVKEETEIHPLTAQIAMDGLKKLYVVVKAIPSVYTKTLEMNS